MRYTLLAAAVAAGTLGMGLSAPAAAVEGMWVPQQLPEIAAPLKKAGLKLDPKQLANLTGDPMGAVVSLGGCTASFVSNQGLVVTNHHCAYGAIQLNSTAQKNLMRDGFNAPTRGEEVSAGPSSRIYALDSIQDVTAQIKAAIDGAASPIERTQAAETLSKRLVAQCEAEAGYSCEIYSFFGGVTYRLFRNIEIKDVRLVYAPPGSIGNYGGEVDNWMWPRHTGDFSFYRAYVGKDGKPAEYAKDNVPYQPKHWLKIADKPLGEGDFVMVAGYPGRTNRYALASEFDATQSWTYPTIAQHYKNLVALVERTAKQDPEIGVKYASTVRGWQNVLKNYDGQLEGFKRIDAGAKKHADETAVLAWLRKRGDAGKTALDAHAKLEELQARNVGHRQRDLVYGQLRRSGAISAATLLYRAAVERAKPDAEREQGYQQRDLPENKAALEQMDRRYDPRMDRELQAYWLREYVKLPAGERIPELDRWLGGNDEKAVKRALDKLAKTKLGALKERLALLNADRATLDKSRDPAIQLAQALLPANLRIEQDAKVAAGEGAVARPAYLQGVIDYRKSQKQAVYPDANSTLRITFGNVKPYTKLDGAKQAAFTKLEEVAAKATGQDPFDAPDSLLEAIADKRYGGLEDKRLKTVPVNFLSDLDITGGNSGSPVLDGQGKLVGLAFDGNWESVSSNWVFDPTMTRMIAVDQRYMRWIMQEVYPAPQVLAELGVAPKKK
ncbi:S46 family peptidase [Lysobacter sp. K5869]|uniref:S46 family peptidase n=1 Tax=Lysobacter sp. K5869 TaxID=2820808 RepID=UPI001C063BC7|nr:S46 family peptidase [Lysobacter sp. K5869]QWP76409.1 S46 family peptidase [Lysobacter sp. K5869]